MRAGNCCSVVCLKTEGRGKKLTVLDQCSVVIGNFHRLQKYSLPTHFVDTIKISRVRRIGLMLFVP